MEEIILTSASIQRTIDESHVRSSWEVIAWEWKVPGKSAGEENGENKEGAENKRGEKGEREDNIGEKEKLRGVYVVDP